MNSSKQNVAYFSDLTLLRRVEKYLEENLDVSKEEMVEDLRNLYKEYMRRNRSAFKATVFKAYDILKSKTLDKYDGANDELEVTACEVESDDDLIDTSANLMDNSASKSTSRQSYLENVQSMVNRGVAKKRQNNSQELINIISSDEEEPKKPREKSPKKFVFDPKNFPDLNIKESSTPFPPFNQRKRKSENSQKRKKEIIPDPVPTCTYADFGGYPKIIETVNNLLLHFYQNEMFMLLGVSPPRGFLLHGPPGSGKTHLAHCIAGELRFTLVSVAAPELVGGMSGESEKKIRDLFLRAKEQIPCVLFIDEIDVICQSRDSSRKEMEKRIVSQLIASFDELNDCEEGYGLIVIGATNRLEVIDPALRRAGRFDKEVCLGIPSRSEREGILKVMCSKVKIGKEISLSKLAELTPGYVAADLKALIREAAVLAINRLFESKKQVSNGEKGENSDKNECEIIEIVEKTNYSLASKMDQDELLKFNIEMDDILKALKNVQPSSKREGFATVPDVTWDDIGSLKEIRQELKMSIMMPVKYPNEFIKMGVEAPSGILLCGPPGCGKTLLAKAVANEANINFISVKGPELLNMYVGESERAVRQCFQRARNSQPCVIFFDEIDALCPKRSDSTEGTVSSRMVNQVLTEMDGVEGREGVFLMAATNRPDMIDPAVLRPGRFDKILFVGLPSPSDRVDILKTITRNGSKPPLAPDVLLEEIGSSHDIDGYSGADLAALVKEASVLALTEYINILEGPQEEMTPIEAKELIVHVKHFNKAIAKIRPSVNPKDQKRYQHLKNLYGQPDDTEMDIETEAVS